MATLDDDFVLDLVDAIPNVRLFSIAPPTLFEAEFDLLVVASITDLANLHRVSAKHVDRHWPRIDVATTQTFDALGPPSYFHRCHPIDVHAIARRARSLREARERETREIEIAIVARESCDSARLLTTLRKINGLLTIRVTATTDDATKICLHDRLDIAIVDSTLPDWGALRAVDWILASGLPATCVGILVDEQGSGPWKLLESRGVLRIPRPDDTKSLSKLLTHGTTRNTARQQQQAIF